MKKVVFIKLGGSLITYKDKPYTSRISAIKKIAQEIKEIHKKNPELQLILGNGAGSFGHCAAIKYNVASGTKTDLQKYGFSIVQSKVKELNLIVVNELLKAHISAVSLNPSSILFSSNGSPKKIFLDSLKGLISLDITPVLYGDIVYDKTLGSKIFSTEDLFRILIQKLHRRTYVVEKVIYLTTVDGVYDKKGKVIAKITKDNIVSLSKNFYMPEGYDVTGGMLHKVKESLKLAKKGIRIYIVNGFKKNNLKNLLLSSRNPGTVVS